MPIVEGSTPLTLPGGLDASKQPDKAKQPLLTVGPIIPKVKKAKPGRHKGSSTAYHGWHVAAFPETNKAD